MSIRETNDKMYELLLNKARNEGNSDAEKQLLSERKSLNKLRNVLDNRNDFVHSYGEMMIENGMSIDMAEKYIRENKVMIDQIIYNYVDFTCSQGFFKETEVIILKLVLYFIEEMYYTGITPSESIKLLDIDCLENTFKELNNKSNAYNEYIKIKELSTNILRAAYINVNQFLFNREH